MLAKLNHALRRVRNKVARVALGLETAERRVKHHRRQRDRFRRLAKTKAADRAAKYLHRWQKRQGWLRDKHVFLQVVLDKRQRRKRKWLKEHPESTFPDHGLVELDGHQVAAWIAKILVAAREAGYWHGYVISGWRSRSYSRELCENMCGASSCPGRCAGEATNHVGIEEPEGATDVSDPAGLQRYCREHGLPLRGNGEVLPADTPHFSRAGN